MNECTHGQRPHTHAHRNTHTDGPTQTITDTIYNQSFVILVFSNIVIFQFSKCNRFLWFFFFSLVFVIYNWFAAGEQFGCSFFFYNTLHWVPLVTNSATRSAQLQPEIFFISKSLTEIMKTSVTTSTRSQRIGFFVPFPLVL